MDRPKCPAIWDEQARCESSNHNSIKITIQDYSFITNASGDSLHKQPITSIATHYREECYYLFTSSSDASISWKITFPASSLDSENNSLPSLDLVSRCETTSFDPQKFDPQSQSNDSTLSTVSPCGTALLVCSQKLMTIFTIGETAGLNIWAANIPTNSPIVSSHFVSLNPTNTDPLLLFLIGCEDGKITVFDTKRKIKLYELDTSNTNNSSINNIQIQPTPILSITTIKITECSVVLGTASLTGEVGLYQMRIIDSQIVFSTTLSSNLKSIFLHTPNLPIPLAMNFFYFTTNNSNERSLRIAIAFSSSLVTLDCRTGELCDYDYDLFRKGKGNRTENEIKNAEHIHGNDEEDNSNRNMYAYSKGAIQFPSIFLLSAFLPTTAYISCTNIAQIFFAKKKTSEEVQLITGVLKSIVATSDPPEGSPLLASATATDPLFTNSTTKQRLPPRNPLNGTTTSVQNRKSSGYGNTAPVMKLGMSPSMALKKQKQQIQKKKQQQKMNTLKRSKMEYPVDCGLLINPQAHNDYVPPQVTNGESDVPISHVGFHPLATSLAICYVDHSLAICKLPFKNNPPSSTSNLSVAGVSSVNLPSYVKNPPRPTFSHGFGNDLISYRNKIYDVAHTVKSKNSTTLASCLEFSETTNHATFFYNDKFVLTCEKNLLKMNKFKMKGGGGGGGGEGAGEACSREVSSFEHEDAQSVVALTAVNSALSHIVITSSSDRCLRVIDVATGKDYWKVPNGAGRRPAHAIALPNVGANVGLPPECYCLVAAASCDNGGLISLWDVRSGTPAAQFRGHVNRRECCGLSFSPCMRYIGVGSEDPGGAGLFDLRGGGLVTKVSAGRNVARDGAVIDVQFNPLFAQLVTASLGGVVRFYSA